MADYQKLNVSEQSTRQMNQVLLLLKKIHPFFSRLLARYETLYRFLENAATTLTHRSYEANYGTRLAYVARAVECDAPRNIIPDFAPHRNRGP